MGYAGMKDKRGVTTQFCTVFRKTPQDLLSINRERTDRRGGGGGNGSNGGYGLMRVGFIKYFGMQRFGKFLDTHEVGIAVLKGDFQKACDIIMRVKPGDSENENHISLREKR